MNALLSFLDPLLPLALTVTTVLYIAEFLKGRETRLGGLRAVLGVTVAALLTRFVVFILVNGRAPLASKGEAFSTIALSIVVVYVILEILHRDRSTGFLLLAVAAAFQSLALFDRSAVPEISDVLRQVWFGTHAVSAILGYTAFAVSAVYSTLFVLLYADLKRRRFGLVYNQMPPLDVLSRMAIRSAVLGLLFLTAAIIVGAQGWLRVLDLPVYRDPKVVGTLIVWAIYGTGISLHYFAGWRGIRSIGLTLVAFVLMILSSWLVPLFLESVHGVKAL